MAERFSFRSRLLSILFWSVISAAFIGPGTVTTAAAAGATHQLDLLWALVFSTIACIILQEASARITLVSGHSLGAAIAIRFAGSRFSWLPLLIAGSIIFGGMAYQAGNILGAVSGAGIVWGQNRILFTVLIAGSAGALLWWGNDKGVAQWLGVIVALMGIAFVWVAVKSISDWNAVFRHLWVPAIPSGGEYLAIGLIGTTIVPYNLFLASGISKGQPVAQMRWGLSIAILIGGFISMAILLVGTQVQGEFSFEALAQTMQAGLGTWAVWLFGIGLLAAGFTSSVTAPMAAAITARTIAGDQKIEWAAKGKFYRLVWVGVLCTGLVFGLSGIKPIPAIILAQALNGLLLPFISIFLLVVVNDPRIMPRLNPLLSNILLLILVGITTFLGALNLLKAAFATFGGTLVVDRLLSGYLLGFSGLVMGLLLVYIMRLRSVNEPPLKS